MKRRAFTFGLGALFAAPALPLPAAPIYSAAVTEKFATAKLLARCHDRASVDMLQRLMRVNAETARGLMAMLQERQVVAAGNDGLIRALNPLNTNCVPNEAVRARNLAQSAFEAKDKVQDAFERINKPQDADPVDETDVSTDMDVDSTRDDATEPKSETPDVATEIEQTQACETDDVEKEA